MNNGDKVWYKVSGYYYGYMKKVPAEFVRMSDSGKRAYIRFTINGRAPFCEYVKPSKLELRQE